MVLNRWFEHLAPRTLAAGGARPVALLLRARRAGRRSYMAHVRAPLLERFAIHRRPQGAREARTAQSPSADAEDMV
eukprot:scaffold37613_cov67-Phaeocystis_antarctica.AAC.4